MKMTENWAVGKKIIDGMLINFGDALMEIHFFSFP